MVGHFVACLFLGIESFVRTCVQPIEVSFWLQTAENVFDIATVDFLHMQFSWEYFPKL